MGEELTWDQMVDTQLLAYGADMACVMDAETGQMWSSLPSQFMMVRAPGDAGDAPYPMSDQRVPRQGPHKTKQKRFSRSLITQHTHRQRVTSHTTHKPPQNTQPSIDDESHRP